MKYLNAFIIMIFNYKRIGTMYITKNIYNIEEENFDWTNYFSDNDVQKILSSVNYKDIFFALRELLKEEKHTMNISLFRLIKDLIKDYSISSPDILELGAATGLLTRTLLSVSGGKGVLVDSCEESYKKYLSTGYTGDNIEYIMEDIFELKTDRRFDIVCSFGLIEHFTDKKAVIDVHKEFLKDDGYLIILIPMDSNHSRAFFLLHPELNLGYRELINSTEFRNILTENGLDVLKIVKSRDYSYDFVAAICRKSKQ